MLIIRATYYTYKAETVFLVSSLATGNCSTNVPPLSVPLFLVLLHLQATMKLLLLLRANRQDVAVRLPVSQSVGRTDAHTPRISAVFDK